MQIEIDRAKDLESYIREHEKYEQDLGLKRIELFGKVETFKVHRVPISKLIFNIRNGRFAAELKAKEAELKKKLDSNKPEDAKIIQNLLLTQDEKATIALEKSLEKDGQIEPGIITFDGAVIDANRRMAILNNLFDKTHDPKHQFILVAKLPETLGEKDLWRIEAGIQFSKDYKLGYGRVNELLKLRDGEAQGLSDEEISYTLMGRYSPKEVKEQLETLKLIENYLIFIGKPGEYNLVHDEQIIQKFTDLQQYKSSLLRNGLTLPKQLNTIQFGFLMINKTKQLYYKDIRNLRNIVEDEDALNTLLKNYKSGTPLDISEDLVLDSYHSAEEIIENKEESDKPEKLIKKALAAIVSIDKSNKKLKDQQVINLLSKLEKEIKNLLGK